MRSMFSERTFFPFTQMWSKIVAAMLEAEIDQIVLNFSVFSSSTDLKTRRKGLWKLKNTKNKVSLSDIEYISMISIDFGWG